ncbi:cupin domain-containing protein [Kitasatospora sp. NPDC051853]|uniref:cupin domain-containing protein n=1 Tax=Kitasatospora sp. NPDC051853 TaxID=3364058 RepID=UPI0037B44A8E
MNQVDLSATAAQLPAAWASQVLAEVGTAVVKLLRMDGRPLAPEVHPTPEVLLVVEGRLELLTGGADFTLGPGEAYHLAAGVEHAVRPGSHGTLLIVEVPEAAA